MIENLFPFQCAIINQWGLEHWQEIEVARLLKADATSTTPSSWAPTPRSKGLSDFEATSES